MINVAKLDFDLRAAGIPIDGVASDGRIDFRAEATPEQMDQAAVILASHDGSVQTLQEQALTSSISSLSTLNGKDIKTLSTNEVITVLRFLLAQSGGIGADDTIQVSA